MRNVSVFAAVLIWCGIAGGAVFAGAEDQSVLDGACLASAVEPVTLRDVDTAWREQQQYYVRQAIDEANRRKEASVSTLLDGAIYPKVGAVMVVDGRAVGRGHNRAQRLLHAEYYAVIDALATMIAEKDDWSIFKKKACWLRLSTAIELSKFFNRVYEAGANRSLNDLQSDFLAQLIVDKKGEIYDATRRELEKQVYAGTMGGPAIFEAVNTLLCLVDDELGNPLRRPGVALYITLAPCDKCSRMIARLGIPMVCAAHPAVNGDHPKQYSFAYYELAPSDESKELIEGYSYQQTLDPVRHKILQKQHTYASNVLPHKRDSMFIKSAVRTVIAQERMRPNGSVQYGELLTAFERDFGKDEDAPFLYNSKLKRGRIVSVTKFGDYMLRLERSDMEKVVRADATSPLLANGDLIVSLLTEYLCGKDAKYLSAWDRQGELRRVALRCAHEISIVLMRQGDAGVAADNLSKLVVKNLLSSSRPDVFDDTKALRSVMRHVVRLVRGSEVVGAQSIAQRLSRMRFGTVAMPDGTCVRVKDGAVTMAYGITYAAADDPEVSYALRVASMSVAEFRARYRRDGAVASLLQSA